MSRTLLLVAVAILLGDPFLQAQEPSRDLRTVPADALAFASIDVQAIWDSEAFRPARMNPAGAGPSVAKALEQIIGLPPEKVARITVFWPSLMVQMYATGYLPIIVVTAREAVDPRALATRLDKPAVQPKDGQKPLKAELPAFIRPDVFYFNNPEGFYSAGIALGPKTYIMLPSIMSMNGLAMTAYLAQVMNAPAEGPLTPALRLAPRHPLTVAVNLAELAKLSPETVRTAQAGVWKDLFTTRMATLTATLGGPVEFRLDLADAASATKALPGVKDLMGELREEVAERQKAAADDPETKEIVQSAYSAFDKLLEGATYQQNGATILVQSKVDPLPAMNGLVLGFPRLMGAGTARAKSTTQLQELGLVLHSYHDANGNFPQNITDKATGKPLLSWRVALLPYLDQQKLYEKFDLTLPWDHPKNKALLAEMPAIYGLCDRPTKEKGLTHLQMPWAEKRLPDGSPFLVPGRALRITTITDGSSQTAMVVEAKDAVPWTKPEDLLFDPKARPAVGSPDREGFHVLLADGSVKLLKRTKFTDAQLRALMTIDGGEVISLED